MKSEFEHLGYKIIESIYSTTELEEILSILSLKSFNGQFGVREFLLNNKEIANKIFNEKLLKIIQQISPACNKSIKSIYFDKPPTANWIVNWHQDLTISLLNRKDIDNYKNWRKKDERTIVQPDIKLLENIFTIRIHLDDCNEQNGALRVIEESHKMGIIEIKEWVTDKIGTEKICEVRKGGILLMKPLILHSSKRTENNKSRRIIHIEFTDQELPIGLTWKEKIEFEEL